MERRIGGVTVRGVDFSTTTWGFVISRLIFVGLMSRDVVARCVQLAWRDGNENWAPGRKVSRIFGATMLSIPNLLFVTSQ